MSKINIQQYEAMVHVGLSDNPTSKEVFDIVAKIGRAFEFSVEDSRKVIQLVMEARFSSPANS